MTAGYDYSFIVQARDQSSNNIAKTLAEAAGSDFSVAPYLTSNSGINFSGTISDDTDPGVYLVEMTVPMTQTTGTYNYNV